MNGIIAQKIALVSHANDFLNTENRTRFYPNNTTLQHCHYVDFRILDKSSAQDSPKEIIVAAHPLDWFELLKKESCTKLRLFFQSNEKNDHKLAGFVGGGGQWFIECVYKDYSDFWIAYWQHDKNLKTQPWKVTYGKALSHQPTIDLQYDSNEVISQLSTLLNDISTFAKENEYDNWGAIFDRALESLHSQNPEKDYYHFDLLCQEHYTLESRQLLMAATKAFVFGGMGSWNDIYLKSDEAYKIYENLSEALFNHIRTSIVCAVNRDKFE